MRNKQPPGPLLLWLSTGREDTAGPTLAFVTQAEAAQLLWTPLCVGLLRQEPAPPCQEFKADGSQRKGQTLCSPSKPFPPTARSKPFPTQSSGSHGCVSLAHLQTQTGHKRTPLQVGPGSEWEHTAPLLLTPAEKVSAQQSHFFSS